MTDEFSCILKVDVPETLQCDDSGKNPAFSIRFTTDGQVPFPQIILHTPDGQRLFKADALQVSQGGGREYHYTLDVPAGLLRPGEINVQVEGCLLYTPRCV